MREHNFLNVWIFMEVGTFAMGVREQLMKSSLLRSWDFGLAVGTFAHQLS